MQRLRLCLVVVFGGITLITRNLVLVMLKLTLIYAAIGSVMLKPN
jgi:intracellular septation protein A